MEKARVIKKHTPEFEHPLKLIKADIVRCTERSTYWKGWIYCPDFKGVDGWIPNSLLEHWDKNEYIVLEDYNSLEMSVEINDEVYILKETNGWAWVKNSNGEKGWIPLENLEKK